MEKSLIENMLPSEVQKYISDGHIIIHSAGFGPHEAAENAPGLVALIPFEGGLFYLYENKKFCFSWREK